MKLTLKMKDIRTRKDFNGVKPFTRIERRKDAYRRNPKHKGRGWE